MAHRIVPKVCLGWRRTLAWALALLFGLASWPVHAARQGELAPVSSGSITITASVAAEMRASSISGAAAIEKDQMVMRAGCVSSNTVTGAYTVQATQRSGKFNLTWSDGKSDPVSLSSDTPVADFQSDRAASDCHAGLRIQTIDGPLGDGPLADVITVLIAPA